MAGILRVLLIDDEEADALLTVAELRRGGYQPQWTRVDSAATLLAAVQDQEWDLITCDWVMPGFGGPAALELLRENAVGAPIIVVSGQVGEEYAVTAMRAGAQDFVSKHNMARLFPAVERELREVAVRRAHRQSQEHVHFQADLLNAVGQAVVAADLDGRITFWNRAAEELYGWTSEEALGQEALNLAMSDDSREVEGIVARLRQGESGIIQLSVRHRDGRVFPVLIANSPVRDSRGRLLGAVGVSFDMTERVRAAQELEELTLRQSAILDALPAHVAVLDSEGTLVAVNRAWRRFASENGLSTAHCGVGINYFTVCDAAKGADADEVEVVVRGIRAILDGSRDEFEIEYPCHSPHEQRWFRVLAAPLGSGPDAGAVVLHINVTERVVAERALEVPNGADAPGIN